MSALDEARRNLKRNVLQHMAARGLSVLRAAELAGSDRKTLTRVLHPERDERSPSLRTMAALAELFGTTVSGLLAEDAPIRPPATEDGRGDVS